MARALTDEEITELELVAANTGDEWMRRRNVAMFRLLVFAGVEQQQLARLTLADVDAVRDQRTAEAISAYLPARADFVRDYEQAPELLGPDAPLIVSSMAGPLSERAIRKWLVTLCDRARMEPVSFHDLRRTHRARQTCEACGQPLP